VSSPRPVHAHVQNWNLGVVWIFKGSLSSLGAPLSPEAVYRDPRCVTKRTPSQSLQVEFIPKPRLVHQHAIRVEQDSLLRKQFPLRLLVLTARHLFPITLEAADELDGQLWFSISPSATYTCACDAPMTRDLWREWVASQSSSDSAW
jgi:hypothetical protein